MNRYTVIFPHFDDGKLVVEHTEADSPKEALTFALEEHGMFEDDIDIGDAVVFADHHHDVLGLEA